MAHKPPKHRAPSKENFTVAQMKRALRAVEGKISPSQRNMLIGHYERREASMNEIAGFGGYDSYGAANIHYGKLAGLIAAELKFRPRNWTYTIASGPSHEYVGGFRWKLDDVVARALEELGWVSPCTNNLPEEEFEVELKGLPKTTRDALIQARIGQGKFRSDVIRLWKSCAVTGCSVEGLLEAAHIAPWSSANNEERLDVHNGLLLTPNFHKLFDQLLITFNDDGPIRLSRKLANMEMRTLGVNAHSRLRFVKPQMRKYLQRHRALFSKMEQG